ncbi:hypothetical protein Hthe01_15520 [Hydrogenophilus thermoluteolus]|uniref:PAS domain-containing sensor histidine kinase n=1 Tax=Hydrogenophilus thermoluteolus TaxID=297 RepID=UPI0024A293BB|nr:PAS domain S-box protein [Hydrogenophilus thermoluteolus]GLW61203.1 hypothetical protein Hthe01_15520 [Hydrogenophilus thermoluteolus]
MNQPDTFAMVAIALLTAAVVWLSWLQRRQHLRLQRLLRERDRLFHFSLDLLALLTPKGEFQQCNAAFTRVLGYTERLLLGKSLFDLTVRDDWPHVDEAMAFLRQGEPASFTVRMKTLNGAHRWLSWHINPAPDDGVWFAAAHDVTQQKEVEAALRSEMAFRRAMESSVSLGLRATDLEGRITFANPAFCRMVGFDRDELEGKMPPFPYWPEEDWDLCQRTLQMVLAGQTPPEGYEMRIKHKNGERRIARFYVSPLIDESGKQSGWMAAILDITEQKRTRLALEAAQQRFETVLDGVDALVFAADWHTDELLFVNRAFKRVFGFDALGKRARDLGAPAIPPPESDPPKPMNTAEHVPEGVWQGDWQHHTSGRWYHVREQLTAWVDGRVVRMVVATDITAQREAIEAELQQMAQLHQTARLITLGEMASMLAHELNQPIAAIANYCRGALLRWRQGRLDSEVVGEVLQKAAEQAERAGTIVRRIRAFARQSAPQQQWVDAVTIAREAIELLRVDAQRRGITVRTQLPQNRVMISADKILLEQVLVNLIRNAFDAMQSVPPKQRELTLTLSETEAEVCYRIADRGVGISEEVRSRLDTPFFTTKPDVLGLGLRICRAILEAHKGRLALLARPGGGTVAEVWLPRAQGGASHDAQG